MDTGFALKSFQITRSSEKYLFLMKRFFSSSNIQEAVRLISKRLMNIFERDNKSKHIYNTHCILI